ncbi:hypothetical protein [Bosea sp. (in: a-proteobacteria)]|jgi:hypothetical protein
MRCLFILTAQALARSAMSYEVVRTLVTDAASDPDPSLARCEIAS